MKIFDLVPPIFLDIWRKYKAKKPLLYPKSPLLEQNKQGQALILMGNGPSFAQTAEKYEKEILSHDRLVVNYFAMSDYFERFKPNYYLMVDPYHFNEDSPQKLSVEKLITRLIEKTTWPMQVCVPISAKDSNIVKRLRDNNPNISLIYFETTPRRAYYRNKYELWDKNYTMPYAQNSMNVGLYLSLFWGYSETYLVGIDMTALEELRVDQKSNELFSIDTHFYDNKKVCEDKGVYDEKSRRILSKEWTLHEYLYAYALVLEGFYELGKYAEYKGLKVYNACEYSWVNYFERKKLH